jgi:hypothetical protein
MTGDSPLLGRKGGTGDRLLLLCRQASYSRLPKRSDVISCLCVFPYT